MILRAVCGRQQRWSKWLLSSEDYRRLPKMRDVIGIQLFGWLGNQMFQYATARTLADRLGCSLIIAGYTLGPRLGIIGHLLGMDRRQDEKKVPQRGMQQHGVLRAAFGLGPTVIQGRAMELAMPHLQRWGLRWRFSPRRVALGNGGACEEFDETLFDQVSGTWLDGWFQSEAYFTANRDRVREWFRAKPEDEGRLEHLMSQWAAPPEQMAAIHVRRGDYALYRDTLSDGEQGWLLPMRYYRHALSRIPHDVKLAIFSDDPDWAAHEFVDRRPWVSRGNSPVIDMLLMARCRWNVIANSSFSWWAGWLNVCQNKAVMAPRYHLGWKIGRWVPGGIEVAGWEYLTATA
jgi:hypothetical protein